MPRILSALHARERLVRRRACRIEPIAPTPPEQPSQPPTSPFTAPSQPLTAPLTAAPLTALCSPSPYSPPYSPPYGPPQPLAGELVVWGVDTSADASAAAGMRVQRKITRGAAACVDAAAFADADEMGDAKPPPPRAAAPVEKLVFLESSRLKPLLAASADGYLCVWAAAAGTLQMQVHLGHHVGESITGLVADESRDLLVTGDAGGCIKVRALTILAPLTMLAPLGMPLTIYWLHLLSCLLHLLLLLYASRCGPS